MHFKIDCSQTILNGWTNLLHRMVRHFAYLLLHSCVCPDTYTNHSPKKNRFQDNRIDRTGLANVYCACNCTRILFHVFAFNFFFLEWKENVQLIFNESASAIHIHPQIVFDSTLVSVNAVASHRIASRIHSMHIPIFIATQSYKNAPCTYIQLTVDSTRYCILHRPCAFLINSKKRSYPKSHCLGNSLLDVSISL